MFKITIIAVGKLKDKNLDLMAQEYIKRIRPYAKLEIKEIKDEGIIKESEKIIDLLDENTFILDATGTQFTSEDFSDFLKKREDIKFIIGGPVGFTNEVRKLAKTVSISKMTFTHEMARVLLLEQIYRAKMIEKGKPYHK